MPIRFSRNFPKREYVNTSPLNQPPCQRKQSITLKNQVQLAHSLTNLVIQKENMSENIVSEGFIHANMMLFDMQYRLDTSFKSRGEGTKHMMF